ncbi:hypothetical protein MMPV_005619 [Pyropia vietnamensis]
MASPSSPFLPPPRIGVLELHGDFAEHTAMLRARGAATVPVRTAADLTSDPPLDGLVLPGGESSTMAVLLDALNMTGPLRDLIAGGLPAFGTCAGAILLSDEVVGKGGESASVALGGLDVAIRRNGYGTQVHSFEAETEWLPADADAAANVTAAADTGVDKAAGTGGAVVAPLPNGPLRVVLIRAPVFERVGPGVEVLVSHEGRAVMVRGGSQRHVLAATFHPELTGDGRVHALFLGIVDERRRRLIAGKEEVKPAV